ncbi:DUF3147 family protein [uncultured Bradyrhizobium sp.]|uniref:DUF3147 family protein n=1 Tax=uncultured Bradyrhizobium sp. TaxID=199684 RepID=UPI0035CC2D5F
MLVRVSTSSLKDSRWYEYVVRFALGGAATVFTGVLTKWFGPSVGGLFLALPAIFCASATLISSHEKRRKREAGATGNRRGQEAAALDAAGAALGSLGMLGFAAAVYLLVGTYGHIALAAAFCVWALAALAAWWIWLRVRRAR